MAFFTADKLKRRRIKIDQSSKTAQSAEVRNRLQRINDNYQAFDELFAEVQATIENDQHLSAFNANLRSADLQPKRKKRWRSNASKRTTKKKSGRRSATASKIKNAQISLNQSTKNKRGKVSPSAKTQPTKKPR